MSRQQDSVVYIDIVSYSSRVDCRSSWMAEKLN
jgi:hypothetical protein